MTSQYIRIKEELMNQIDLIKKENQLSGKPNLQININNLKTAIINACDIKYIDYSKNQNMKDYTYGIYNPVTKCYERNDQYLSYLIEAMISSIKPEPNIVTVNAKKGVDNGIMSSLDYIEKANLPDSSLIKFNNCIYDLKSGKHYQFDDEDVKKYDFINTIPYNLKSLDEINQDKLNIVKTILNDWSQNDCDIELLLRQFIFAAVEGNGRDVHIILKSEGGDGKSTFLTILENLVSDDLTVHINLDEYNDDNILNKIQPSTKLLIGDDLQSNFKMGDKTMSRFKSLTSGGSISVSEKYMPNKLISCRGLKIQATNTDVKFFENNSAIQDRILYLNWPHYNFRRNPNQNFDLDKLIGKYSTPDKEFMEAILSYAIYSTRYFDRFNITNKMKADLEEVLDDADSVLQHYHELEGLGVFTFSHIPSSVMYEHYKYWIKLINPSSNIMKQSEYTKRLDKILSQIGYTESTKKRLRQIRKDQFDLSIFHNLTIDETIQSKIFINPSLNIENMVDEIRHDLSSFNHDEIKQKYDEKMIRSYINFLKSKDASTILIIFAKYQINEINDLDIDTLINQLIDYYQE